MNFIGLASESCLGNDSGLETLLKGKYPLHYTNHCKAHRLEFAVNNAVDSVTSVTYLRIFIHSLYSLYSHSLRRIGLS